MTTTSWKSMVDDVEERTVATECSSELMFEDRIGTKTWNLGVGGKLYSRTKEQDVLHTVYRRMKDVPISSSATELILIHGATGVGKTALARSLQSTVTQDGGFFVNGKFDQRPSPEPYSAFVAALTVFSKTVVGRGEECVQELRNVVHNYIRADLTILTDMVPALKAIFDMDNAVDTKSSTVNDNVCFDATNRFKYVFRMFIRAISSREKPVVLVLDDLHWADESSLDLLHSLLIDTPDEGIIYVATYRDDSASSRETLTKMLNRIEEFHINKTTIGLQNFEVDDLNVVLSELLQLEPIAARSLSDFMHQCTKGNMFYVLQYLRSLLSEDRLVFNQNDKSWKWDIDGMTVPTTTLHEFMKIKIQELPEESQSVLTYAACLGSKWDAKILQHLIPTGTSALAVLSELTSFGIVEHDETDGSWKFSHDGIHEAIYHSKEVSCDLHYRIGLKLWEVLSLEELDKYIFVIVGQLLFGIDLMIEEEERVGVSKLCLRAGEAAIESSCFRSAFSYLTKAIKLLGQRSWRDHYEYTLHLYNAAAEVAYCVGDFDSVSTFVDETIKNARLFDHTLQAHATRLRSLGTAGRIFETVEKGLEVLKQLGEKFPPRTSRFALSLELKRLKRRLKGKTEQDILQLPLMDDPSKLAAMKIIGIIHIYAFLIKEEFAAFLGLRIVSLTLDYGQSVMSYLGFVTYGNCMLTRVGNDAKEGFRIGRVCLLLYENFGIVNWVGRAYCGYYGTALGLSELPQKCVDSMKYAYLVALEKGDVEFAFLNWSISCFVQAQTANLPDLNVDLVARSKQMALYGQAHSLVMMKPLTITLQYLLNTSNTSNNLVLNDSEYDNVPQSEAIVNWCNWYRMWLNYLFGQYDKAAMYAKPCMVAAFSQCMGTVDLAFVLFFAGLARVEKARQSKRRSDSSAVKCLRFLQNLSQHAPTTLRSKQCLLEAELCTLRRNPAPALEKYTTAISYAKKAGFIMETALCNERAAKFSYIRGDLKQSMGFFKEALVYYGKWGSEPKVAHLTDEIRSCFASCDAMGGLCEGEMPAASTLTCSCECEPSLASKQCNSCSPSGATCIPSAS